MENNDITIQLLRRPGIDYTPYGPQVTYMEPLNLPPVRTGNEHILMFTSNDVTNLFLYRFTAISNETTILNAKSTIIY